MLLLFFHQAEVIRIATRDSFLLPSHSSYVQGVAWDPLGQMVVTQSADRSVKAHKLNTKPGVMVKLASRGHSHMKMLDNNSKAAAPANAAPLTAADFDPAVVNQKSKNLYADATVPSFFRRPAFSPDARLLVTPTGVYKNIKNNQMSFCTHLYSRNMLNTPVLSFVGLEDPSVAVRFSPVLYKPVAIPDKNSPPEFLIPGSYRMIFAVISISSVFVYDTQHPHPIARLGGLHLACINDATWTADGTMLIVCSSDGYLSFIKFDAATLGEPLADADLPDAVKLTHPSIYGHLVPPAPDSTTGGVSASATTTTTAEGVNESKPKVNRTATSSASPSSSQLVAAIIRSKLGNGASESSPADSASTPVSDSAQLENNETSVKANYWGANTEQASPVTQLAAAGEKKRRRITPELISTTTSGSGNVTFTSSSVPQSPAPVPASTVVHNEVALSVDVSAFVNPVDGSVDAAGKKVKKRIAPTLISTAIGSVYIASSSSSSSSSSSVTVAAQSDQSSVIVGANIEILNPVQVSETSE